MQRTVIVIPCYNEGRRLQVDVFRSALRDWPWLSLILVDDGSHDDTRLVLHSIAEGFAQQAQVLGLPANRGKAEAVRQGVLLAAAQAPAFFGYLDADLATPLSELIPMLALFERPAVHVVMGSRIRLLGRSVQRSPLRHYLGRVFASSASLVLGLGVYDTQCGAKLFRNTDSALQVFAEPFSVNWTFDVEIIARFVALARRGELPPPTQSLIEHPLATWRDVAGSKLGSVAALQAGFELFQIWSKYRPGRPGRPD